MKDETENGSRPQGAGILAIWAGADKGILKGKDES